MRPVLLPTEASRELQVASQLSRGQESACAPPTRCATPLPLHPFLRDSEELTPRGRGFHLHELSSKAREILVIGEPGRRRPDAERRTRDRFLREVEQVPVVHDAGARAD